MWLMGQRGEEKVVSHEGLTFRAIFSESIFYNYVIGSWLLDSNSSTCNKP